jgi:hypothetical protein
MDIDEHDVLAWIEDVKKYSKLVEAMWPNAPKEVEDAIVEAMGGLDLLELKLKEYVEWN